MHIIIITRSALGRAHLPLTTVLRRLKTMRCCFDGPPIPVRAWGVSTPQNHTLLLGGPPIPVRAWHFSDVIIFRVAVHTLWEKGIRFQHLDYDADRAQKLISLSMSRHLSTRNISSKSRHSFLSNLAHRQTDEVGVRRKTYISCIVGGK